MRFSGRGIGGWTTHYVCCADDQVFDPIVGEPVPVSDFAERVFGRKLPIERVLDVDDMTTLRARLITLSRQRP